MKPSILAASTIIGAVALGATAIAQDKPTPGMGMQHGEGMHGGMMGMMDGCPMMRQGRSPGATSLIPRLPPGNEKLQAQMTAEIMQKAGEIASKYAAQAK